MNQIIDHFLFLGNMELKEIGGKKKQRKKRHSFLYNFISFIFIIESCIHLIIYVVWLTFVIWAKFLVLGLDETSPLTLYILTFDLSIICKYDLYGCFWVFNAFNRLISYWMIFSGVLWTDWRHTHTHTVFDKMSYMHV